MIIDALTHVTPDGKWFSTNFDASESRLLKEMDEASVDLVVVVALAGIISNDFVASVWARHPDRVIPVASLNPNRFSNDQEIDDALKKIMRIAPFRAIKFHPKFNRFCILDPRFIRVLSRIAAMPDPLPIWLCTFMDFPQVYFPKSPVEMLHEIVGRFPTLTFLLLHGGGCNILRLAESIRLSPNAYIDISFTLHRYLKSSVKQDISCLCEIFDQRLVFGSDFPEVSLQEALSDFEETFPGSNESAKKSILSKNLLKILGMRK